MFKRFPSRIAEVEKIWELIQLSDFVSCRLRFFLHIRCKWARCSGTAMLEPVFASQPAQFIVFHHTEEQKLLQALNFRESLYNWHSLHDSGSKTSAFCLSSVSSKEMSKRMTFSLLLPGDVYRCTWFWTMGFYSIRTFLIVELHCLTSSYCMLEFEMKEVAIGIWPL